MGTERDGVLVDLVDIGSKSEGVIPSNEMHSLGADPASKLSVGEKVLVEGTPSDGLFLILAGDLLVQKKDAMGGLITLNILREGDVAGEISLLTNLPATATVAATRKTVVAFLSRESFSKLLVDFPSTGGYLQQLTQKRLAGIASALLPAEVLDADQLVLES